MKFFEDGRRSSENHHSTLVELDYVEGSWLVKRVKFFEDGRKSSENHHSTLLELDYVEGSWLVSRGGTRTTSTSRKQPGAQQ